MSYFNDKLPDLLKIKGYKYRAKMIIAALVILIVIIVLFSSIIAKVSSSNDDDKDENNSGESVSSQINEPSSSAAESKQEESSSNSDSAVSSAASKQDYDYDADGKVVIDTDTLDGKKAVALTFDDGPGEYTPKLIEGLNARNAKATFFMVGSCVSEYPNALPLMVEGGHQLGSHTYDHSDITKLSKDQLNEQLSKTDDEIYKACGQRATAFRPPYGSYEDDIVSGINKTITLWSLDTMDWESRNAESVKKKIVSGCQDGDIILLHDIYETSVDGALQAIDELQKKGYVFVTVDELLSRYGYDVVHGKAHNAQFAVYETNSPEAEKYESEIAASQAAMEAASAASAFYYSNESNSSDTSTESASDTSRAANANFPQNSSVPAIY